MKTKWKIVAWIYLLLISYFSCSCQSTRSFEKNDTQPALQLKPSYTENQPLSTEFDPTESSDEVAFDYYMKAKNAADNPDQFHVSGTTTEQSIKYLEKALEVYPDYHAASLVLAKSKNLTGESLEAKRLFSKAIDLKPHYPEAHVSFGFLLISLQEYDEALLHFQKALDLGAISERIYLGMAQSHHMKGNYEKAKSFYKQVYDANEEFGDGHAALPLSEIYLKEGDIESSWQYLRKTIPFLEDDELSEIINEYKPYLKKHNFFAFCSLGYIHYHSLKYEEAIEYLEKALKVDPHTFGLNYELGTAYAVLGRTSKAVYYLEKTVSKNPNNYTAHIELARLLSNDDLISKEDEPLQAYLKRHNRAIELLEQAKLINPDNYLSYYILGRLYYRYGEYRKALSEMNSASEIDANTFVKEQLGDIYFMLERYSDALLAYKEAVETEDYDLFAQKRIKIADTYLKLKETDKAIDFLRECLKDDDFKKSTGLRNKLAEAMKQNGYYTTAINLCQEVISLDADNYTAYIQIGEIYFLQEEWAKAETWLLKLLNIYPEDSASNHNLGLVYMNKSEFSKALSYFRKALKLDPNNLATIDLIEMCEQNIEKAEFPKKLRRLSHEEGMVGQLAKVMLCIEEYGEANDMLIQGKKETEPVYERIYDERIITSYDVSSKIYTAQGIFSKIQSDLEQIRPVHKDIKGAVDLFSIAAAQRQEGIEEYAKGYYVTKKDYSGEWEKGEAKNRLADKYFLQGLEEIKEAFIRNQSHFGSIVMSELQEFIEYFRRKYEQ